MKRGERVRVGAARVYAPNMPRRVVAVLMAGAVLASVVVACSSDGGSKGGADAGQAGESSVDTGRGGASSEPGPAASAGQGEPGDGDAAGAPNSGAGGAPASQGDGDVPMELVGVWQETRASGGDYVNSLGENFSVTSGFSVQVRISANGSYQWSHYASGASSSCPSVSYFDRSAGFAVLSGDVLTLHPTQHEIDVNDCTTHGTEKGSLEPVALTISVEDAFHYYGDLRTYKMSIEGAPQPLELTLLVRPPLAEPPQPPQPASFSLGQDPPFAELQGLWVPSPGSDSTFFDPETGDYHFPELDGNAHQWLRFVGENYESAAALQNINAEGVCKADLIYYEQGRALMQVLDDVGGQHNHFNGDMRFEATAARLIVRVRECDEDDAVYQYDLPGQLSYYSWMYYTADTIGGELFSVNCNYDRSEWQSTLCQTRSFYRRE